MEDPRHPDPAENEGDRPARRVRPVDLRDYVRVSEREATRTRVYTTDQLALDLWCVEPQQATPVLHESDRDLTYLVLGGRSWFVTDDGEVGLDPMGSMLVPAGTVHAIDNRAPDPLVVVAVSAPPSDEPETTPEHAPGLAVRERDDERGLLRRLAESLLGTSGGERS